jgi:hypothetical protein
MSNLDALQVAKWCYESCFAVRKNGQDIGFLVLGDTPPTYSNSKEFSPAKVGIIGLERSPGFGVELDSDGRRQKLVRLLPSLRADGDLLRQKLATR